MASAATPAATERVLNLLLTIVILLVENGWQSNRPTPAGPTADPRHRIR